MISCFIPKNSSLKIPKKSRPKIPARKPNYTLPLSLCPAAKRHGIRIKETCLTVNNLLLCSIHSRQDYMNQTLFIFERGQTDCHSGLLFLGSRSRLTVDDACSHVQGVKVGLGSFIHKIHAQTRVAGISRYQRIAHTLLIYIE